MCCQRWRIHVIYWLFSFDYMPWTLFSHSLLLCVFFFSGSKSAFCWDHIKTYIWTSRINIDLLSVVNDPSNQMQITSQILALTLCSLEKKNYYLSQHQDSIMSYHPQYTIFNIRSEANLPKIFLTLCFVLTNSISINHLIITISAAIWQLTHKFSLHNCQSEWCVVHVSNRIYQFLFWPSC